MKGDEEKVMGELTHAYLLHLAMLPLSASPARDRLTLQLSPSAAGSFDRVKRLTESLPLSGSREAE